MKSKKHLEIFRFLPIVLICVILSVSGCGGPSWVDDRLDVAEDLMEIRPDSALVILDSIHPALLKDKTQKARYALLKSMALDKNYIDKISFEVLQPAIDHYAEYGTSDEKLRTFYYQGRIYENRNENDSALRSFMRGLDIYSTCRDSLTIARTFVAQGIIYKNFYDYEGYFTNYLKAAEIYSDLQYTDYEFDCLLNALNGLIILRDKEKSDSVLNLIYNINSLDDVQVQGLKNLKTSYSLAFGSEQDLRKELSNMEGRTYDSNEILNFAKAYHKLGENDRARYLLEYLDENKVHYDTLKFLSIQSSILESLGIYKEALSTYRQFSRRLETVNSAKFEQKSRSMQEKHQLELQAEIDAERTRKLRLSIIIGSIFLGMGAIILLLLIRRNKIAKNLALQKAYNVQLENESLKNEKERLALANSNLQLERDKKSLEAENLAHRVAELESESDDLRELLESQQEMPSEVRKAIQTRIEMLNSYLASQISDHKEFEKTYDDWVADLTANTQEFMDSNRLAFQASHPAFIKHFEDHDLTTSEINYVCLYAIGLRGKDVGNYMKKRSHVNISSVIRRKLGIDQHDTNIGIYVRKLLKQL